MQAEKRKTDEQARIEQELQKQVSAKTQWTDTNSKLKRKEYVDKIIDTLKVQVMPYTECVEPNDAFVKRLFRFGNNNFKKALMGKKFCVKEKKEAYEKERCF